MLTLATILDALQKNSANFAFPREGTLRADDVIISDAVIDSRRASPGALFVALKGENVDGHDFVADAFQRGASLALIERPIRGDFPTLDLRHAAIHTSQSFHFGQPVCLLAEDSLQALQHVAHFWRRKLPARVIGITGSVGKSTTKEAVADILAQRYHTLRNEGNLNNEIGLPLSLLRLTEEHERAVLEMGFYVPGEIAFLCEIAQPEVGVITNIGSVHAERAGSYAAIASGKAELIQSLPAHGVAVLNYDDEWVRSMADKTSAQVFFYGMTPAADLWADHVRGLGLDGVSFVLHHQGEEIHVHTPMLGTHSVQTSLRAAAVALLEGLTWQEIHTCLQNLHNRLRMLPTHTSRGALVLDDTYNASPESTLAALNLLAEVQGRKIAILGDMLELGPYEIEGHQQVGLRVAKVAEQLITVGVRAHTIAASARTAGLSPENIREFETSQEAAAYLQDRFSQGDTILVKGSRGVHMEKIIDALEVIP